MKRFLKACGFLSKRIYSALSTLPEDFCRRVCEIRLRAGKPLSLVTFDGCMYLTATGRLTGLLNTQLFAVTRADLKESFNRLCEYSVYSHSNDIASGFITVSGGHRAGVYGTAVYSGGQITGMRDVGGINMRVAREFCGCAQSLVNEAFKSDFAGFLLCGAPSTGKTTLLRDCARIMSDSMFKKVAVVDERGEIAAVSHGEAQNNVGVNTDVLDGYIKSQGILQAVRTLSPDVIVCDELGGEKDIDAVISAVNSGVVFAAAVHATNTDDIKNKPQLYSLVKTGAFSKLIFLKSGEPCKICETVSVGGDF
ncbi:MAG: Flp pilus assembly complex ATPase component TadA [Clostridia bacterium]|nr:Flp pilus assembly complex ATPase component TadA [Clostridia bacterium]